MNNQRLFLLGLLFVVALSILAFYTLFLTDIHLFKEPILKTVYFPEAYGLREGDPVQVLGARIGRVRTLEPQPNAEPNKFIRTVLSLDEEIELKHGAVITIQESTLLGGRHVDIYPGEFGGPPLEPGPEGAYFGRVKKNPITALGDLGSMLTENRETLKNILSNLESVTSDVKTGKGVVGRLIADEDLGNKAASILTSVEETATALKAGEGLLGALIYDQGLKDSANRTFARIEKVGADIEAGQGLIGAMLYDQELKDKTANGLKAFAEVGTKINSGVGTVGRLVNDEALADDLQTVVTNLRGATEDIRSVVAQVRTGEGSLGKLLIEDELYQETLRTVRLLTRSLEDYREAAPITAFTGVLFAAF